MKIELISPEAAHIATRVADEYGWDWQGHKGFTPGTIINTEDNTDAAEDIIATLKLHSIYTLAVGRDYNITQN